MSKLPGVEAAGGVTALPLSGSASSGTATADTRAVPPREASFEADWRIATPDYFRAMGISLVRGRYFTDADSDTSAPVAIIDETLATTYWPGEDPVGKRIRRGGQRSRNPWMTIVGVVKHVRYRTLEAQSRTQLYWPYAQNASRFMSLSVRTAIDARTLAPAIERQVLAVDPDQPVYQVRTMLDLVADSTARRRFSLLLLAIFAAVALVLAAIGIYGVISYAVTQRAHEIGVRMAVGASRLDVLCLVLGQSLRLALLGVGLGLAGSVALTRLIASLLFRVTATDPLTFGCVAGLLVAVSLVAGFLPARRATRVDPVVVLRYE